MNAPSRLTPPLSSTPPFLKGGLGGISDVGTPARHKIPPNPPLRKGGTSAESPVPQVPNDILEKGETCAMDNAP